MKFKPLPDKQIGVIDGDVQIGLISYYCMYKEWRFATVYMNAFTGKQLKKVSKKLKELNSSTNPR